MRKVDALARTSFLVPTIFCSLVAVVVSEGQTLGPGVINAPPTVIGDNESIGSNTTVNVFDGGSVGEDFQVGLPGEMNIQTELNVLGGELEPFSIHKGAVANISGGVIGTPRMSGSRAFEGGVINVSGGQHGGFSADPDGEVVVTGGDIGFLSSSGVPTPSQTATFNVSNGTINFVSLFRGDLNISGGDITEIDSISLGSRTVISGDAQVGAMSVEIQAFAEVRGGTVDLLELSFDGAQGTDQAILNLRGGQVDRLRANAGLVRVYAKEFALDGVPITGLTMGEVYRLSERDVTLSGTWQNGAAYGFELNTNVNASGDFFGANVVVDLVLVPEPSIASVIGIGGLISLRRKHVLR